MEAVRIVQRGGGALLRSHATRSMASKVCALAFMRVEEQICFRIALRARRRICRWLPRERRTPVPMAEGFLGAFAPGADVRGSRVVTGE